MKIFNTILSWLITIIITSVFADYIVNDRSLSYLFTNIVLSLTLIALYKLNSNMRVNQSGR